MKLITTIVRPERLPEVKAALFQAGVTGITLSRVSGHGGDQDIVSQYRGTTVVMEFHEKVKIEMVCSEPFVEPCIKAILSSARTGEVGDCKIFVQPIERVIRIRTGELDHAALTAVNSDAPIPLQAHAMFQLMFAIITPALISGAIVERMRFRAYVVFLVLWATFVYDPLAHWVWGSGGWLAKLGALDFAGGTVVHISAGVSALVAASMLGPRKDFKRTAIVPHNVPLVLLGAGLLWFGWFGFNAGSALAANGLAALAFTNTNTAAATALVAWVCLDLLRTGKATAVGAATGLVVGLVGITPAAGYITAPASLAVGALAALGS